MLRALVFIVSGVFLLGIGGYVAFQESRLVATQAEVTRVGKVDGTEWRSTVRFTTTDGKQVTEDLKPSRRQTRIGDRVDVRYRPGNPDTAHFPEDGQNLYLWPGLGVLVIGLGVWWLVRLRRTP